METQKIKENDIYDYQINTNSLYEEYCNNLTKIKEWETETINNWSQKT